jgi:hypothetical protein
MNSQRMRNFVFVLLAVGCVLVVSTGFNKYVDYVDNGAVYKSGSFSYIKSDVSLNNAFKPELTATTPIYKPYAEGNCSIGYGGTVVVLKVKDDGKLILLIQQPHSLPKDGTGPFCVSGSIGETTREFLTHIR